MAEEITKLELFKKQRAAFKGQLTYFKNQCSSASTLGSFESLLRRIQLVYDKYNAVQLKIESLDDSTGSDRDTFEDDYGSLESTLINKIHELKRSDETSVTFQNSSIHEASSGNAVSMGIRLPELSLPSFNGSESEWLAFRDIFIDLIHKKNIEPTIKFVYLISQIRSGSAYNVIEHLPVTAENYEVAWKAICDKYNNEISIQRFHMREIYDVKGPTENSFKSLQLFVDNIVKHYNALKSLKVKIGEWDLMLTHHLTQKLDTASRNAVIKGSKPTSVLLFSELVNILRTRVQLLQALHSSTSSQQSSRPHREVRRMPPKSFKPSSLVSSLHNCSYCAGSHSITHCQSFNSDKITPKMRFQFIKEKRLCVNCLIETHQVRQCTHESCTICSLRHHVLLHFKNQQPSRELRSATSPRTMTSSNNGTVNPNAASVVNISDQNPSPSMTSILTPVTSSTSKLLSSQGIVMIGTALVNSTDSYGNQSTLRALLDSGSHMNFITTDACNRLGAKRYPTAKTIAGIGGKESKIKHKIYITLSSRVSEFNFELKMYVLPKIINHLPAVRVKFEIASLPVQIKLADPYFNIPDRIDILLGIEIYNQLFSGGSIVICKELPPFYSTELGYVVCGKAKEGITNNKALQSHVVLCNMQTLETQLKQFWELESVSVKNIYSSEENQCEEHYCNTVKRMPDGRYSVGLPVKPNIIDLGSSYLSARRQFLSLEKRLCLKTELYQQYRDFMSEYIELGHMVPVKNLYDVKNYYLPHHYVLKDQSTTTKLRVVFNASSKSSSELSLNDCLLVGPTIQQDLFSIVLRFRKHIFAFCADIAKMYRQILVHDSQQDLQRIWWRDQQSDELKIYKLCTVTYGTASAPFLATRTLKQLTIDEYDRYPAAATVTANDFYVDDVLTGAPTLNEAQKLKTELIEFLSLGGFELRKFCSNNASLGLENQSLSPVTLVLGLSWNTETDKFQSPLDKLSVSSHCSKRNILSEICQLFDPLGLCAPIIVTAKLVMQALWSLQTIGWDDPIPNNIANKWTQFKSELLQLQKVEVPRAILIPDVKRVELHGFGDASERAFGCVFYIRMTDLTNCHHVRLICAKSRVAPLNKQTIPRLELCAALLVAEMTERLIRTLDIAFDGVYLWSDSEITLYRIRSEPHKYATFVANRIAKIQEYTTSKSNWYYVESSSNPADLVSRGLMPSEFKGASLWWDGPKFLYQSEQQWPKPLSRILNIELADLEIRKPLITALSQTNNCHQEIINRFQSLNTLLRVVAYILRFCNNARNKTLREVESSVYLRPSEMNNALKLLVKLVQLQHFEQDIKCLKKQQPIPCKSSLRSLSPFLDTDEILRVGGRLDNAQVPYDRKHPILLPGNHVLSKLIARHEHLRLLHAGPQSLLYNLRLQYWIIGARNLCRTIVNKCIRCFHARPQTRHQSMGALPTERVTQSVRPFFIVGVDFCGPFFVKQTIRSKLNIKCYVCLFVCFTTKAVHLEIVMNLSTEAFIACLRRFVARRGVCKKIYSDNASNFVGARSELKELSKLFMSQQFQEKTLHYCSSQHIEWLTIPARSPHFGGLWESAIKSAKHHMKRVIGSSSVTTEEFYTLITQIEACLNSRPITSMSSDPSDLSALSPGHFLIGSPLTSLMEPSLLDLQLNKLSRFQLIQRQLQFFWHRWKTEYLAELQRRYKWQTGSQKFEIGALVLIHDNNLPPLKWNLGRIIETHPGKDGIIRVVTIRTSQSVLKRAVTQISVLPINNDV